MKICITVQAPLEKIQLKRNARHNKDYYSQQCLHTVNEWIEPTVVPTVEFTGTTRKTDNTPVTEFTASTNEMARIHNYVR